MLSQTFNYVVQPGQGILTIMHKSLTELSSAGLQADALLCILLTACLFHHVNFPSFNVSNPHTPSQFRIPAPPDHAASPRHMSTRQICTTCLLQYCVRQESLITICGWYSFMPGVPLHLLQLDGAPARTKACWAVYREGSGQSAQYCTVLWTGQFAAYLKVSAAPVAAVAAGLI